MKNYFYLLLLVFSFHVENQILAKNLNSSNIESNNSIHDEEITKQVESLLKKEQDILQTHLSILTKNGVVNVYGVVDTGLQANKIVEIIASITDVIDVNTDNLEIKSSKEFLSDAFITAKAKGKIKLLAVSNKIQPGYELHLETTNGVVHIFGKIINQADIEIVKNSVLNIIDVQEVKMNVKCN